MTFHSFVFFVPFYSHSKDNPLIKTGIGKCSEWNENEIRMVINSVQYTELTLNQKWFESRKPTTTTTTKKKQSSSIMNFGRINSKNNSIYCRSLSVKMRWDVRVWNIWSFLRIDLSYYWSQQNTKRHCLPTSLTSTKWWSLLCNVTNNWNQKSYLSSSLSVTNIWSTFFFQWL